MLRIPPFDLTRQISLIYDELREAIDEVLMSGQFVLGDNVRQLEKEIAELCNVKYGIGVASGSDALLLSLLALDLGPGDEVITSPFTFIATAGSISRTGAKIVFCDIDPRTYNLDPSQLEKVITEKTKAIVPVHLYGQPADMDSIREVAGKYNLYVVEDAAQAIGAKYKKKPACSLGDAAALSFFPTKNLGGFGDGGMVLTDSSDIYERVMMLRVHGSTGKYQHIDAGYNSRLDEIQAAIIRVRMNYLSKWTSRRQEIAALYNTALLESKVKIPYENPQCIHVYHQYTIQVKERDNLKDDLASKGISSMIYYPIPLHLQPAFTYLGHKEGDFPIAEKVSKYVLSLPIYPEIKDEEVHEVAGAVMKSL